MIRTTIVPDLLYERNIEIKDSNGITVELTEQTPSKHFIKFRNPFIIIDNFEKMKSKTMEIIRIDLAKLEQLGFRLVSVTCVPTTRWYPRQQKMYVIEDKKEPIPKSEILSSIPKEHFIEMDITNNRIRMKGKNAGYPHYRNEMASRWIQLP